MSSKLLTGLALAVLVGCSRQPERGEVVVVNQDTGQEEPISKELQAAIKRVSEKQSQALKGASVKVHGAYDYHGHSEFQPVAGAKLISVDVEFSGYTADLDLDDVDFIDGGTGTNYGSDPEIGLLSKEGVPQPVDAEWPEAPGPVRVLLINAVLQPCKSIKLGYWESVLTKDPMTLKSGGPVLSKPAERSGRPSGGSDGSQPSRSETNRSSSAVGSSR